MLTHPQIEANGLLSEYEHPIAGRIRQPRPAARFDQTPSAIRRHAPALGEHNAELLEELGYNQQRRQQLIDAGVIEKG